MSTLFIDNWSSECSNCPGISVDPLAPAHTENLGGMTKMSAETAKVHVPCGETYTHLSSHYYGTKEACVSLRPDLLWIGPER